MRFIANIVVAVFVAMATPMTASAKDYLELPNGSKVDLADHCPVFW